MTYDLQFVLSLNTSPELAGSSYYTFCIDPVLILNVKLANKTNDWSRISEFWDIDMKFHVSGGHY